MWFSPNLFFSPPFIVVQNVGMQVACVPSPLYHVTFLCLGENPGVREFPQGLWPFAFDLVLSTLCQRLTFVLECMPGGGVTGPRE